MERKQSVSYVLLSHVSRYQQYNIESVPTENETVYCVFSLCSWGAYVSVTNKNTPKVFLSDVRNIFFD